MAQTFTIDSIEGNSYIGVPVFSRFGQMQNYNYIVMSPQKNLKNRDKGEEQLLDKENLKYKIQPLSFEPVLAKEEVKEPDRRSKLRKSKGGLTDDGESIVGSVERLKV